MCITAVGAAHAKDADPLFADDSTIEVRLTAPFEQIMDDREAENERPGTIEMTLPDGEELKVAVQVRARGNYRKQTDICEFAPLRLNFKKGDLKETYLEKQDKLKLVTHCNNRSENYRQAVVKEYLAYRTLNHLTDISFRVRLLRITYVDSVEGDEQESFAFLIESKERMGKRIEMELSSLQAVNERRLDQAHTNIGSMFQYLVSNLDFSPVQGAGGNACCHNYALYSPDKKTYWSIPYDFDLTGFVEPEHLEPNPEYDQRHTRDRKYRGRCSNNDFLPATIKLFKDKRADIDANVASQTELSSGTRKRGKSFFEMFYKELEKEDKLIRKLKKACI
ncbi:MAG: hypothetical protein ACR2QL_14715 [Woeseiaceae bacterium]